MSARKHILILCSCLLASGCVATQQDMLQMQSQMDDLNTSLANMQRNQAELAVKMEQLSRSLNASSESMKDLSSQLNELGVSVDKRVSAIGQSLRKQQEQVRSELLPAKIYNDAYNAYLNNNFDGAAAGFKSYLSKFPKGEAAEGAYFYLGESLYLTSHWKDAALAYANVLEKYPKSGRVPAARLKYALALLKLPGDKKSEALKYLKSVVRDFPKSQEAKTAKDKIASLSAKPKTRPKSSPKKG